MTRARKKKPDGETLRLLQRALRNEQNNAARELLTTLHPADIARLLESLPSVDRRRVWALVEAGKDGDVLLEVSETVRAELLRDMDEPEQVAAARGLDIDEMADLIPDLSDDAIAELLEDLDRQERARLDSVLSYPEDTAGGLMNVDTVVVREDIALEVVLRYLRRRRELPDHTSSLFVVDGQGRLNGQLSIERLLTSNPDRPVAQVMDREVVSFVAQAPQSEVAAAFERYNLVSAPVVDEDNRLLGRITVDDVVDVIREEAERSVRATAGLSEEEDLFAPVRASARRRALWLGINLITAFIASWVISRFEVSIEKIVALAVLMPIVASMGGNAGTQTLTLVVRGLALGTVSRANAWQVLSREMAVGLLNGLIWALVVGSAAWLAYGTWTLGLVISAAMVINLLAAAFAGVVLPLALKQLGQDPALAGTVLLTTVTDVIGFLSFLGLATIFLL